jgi:hypothetical protein
MQKQKEFQSLILREIAEKHPKILNEFEALAKPYCIRLFDLGEEHHGIPDFIASGTFVRIGKRPGILTNHHVTMVFEVKRRNWIYVPDCKLGKIRALKFDRIISLPHYPPDWSIRGVDISFIELNTEDIINEMGYQIWDLDGSAEKHFTRKINFQKQKAVNNWIWGVEVTPCEQISRKGDVVYFKEAGFHFLGPDKSDTFSATARYGAVNLRRNVDEFYCEIDRRGKDGPKLPSSYGGTSGSALWRGIGELPSETIVEFDLAGILAEEIKFSSNHPVVTVLCRGSNSLYDTFYKFCTHYLLHENDIAALKHAGFKENDLP